MKIYTKQLIALLLPILYMVVGFNVVAQNIKIGGGVNHTVMLCDNRNVYVWGDNFSGESGNGTTGGNYSTAGQHVLGVNGIGFLKNIKLVDAGSGSHNLSLTCSGDSTITWGSNIFGQLGIGIISSESNVPLRVHGIADVGFLTGVKSLAGSTSSSYAIMNDGRVVGWGLNTWGQLGDGTTTNRSYPMYVLKNAAFGGGQLTNIIDFQAGDHFVTALDANGDVWFWGNDARGVGGQNIVCGADGCNNIIRAVKVRNPTNTGYLTNIVKIAAGDRHILALTASDTLYSWGSDWARQLGRGNPGNSGLPAAVFNVNDAAGINILRGVVAIAGGNGHSIAVLASGRVVAWGQQAEGQLGNGVISGTNVNYPIYVLEPAGVNPIENIYNLGEGDNNTFLISSTNQLYTFGMNNLGQLGIGNTTNQRLPVLLTAPCGVAFSPRQPVAKLGPDQLLCSSTSIILDAGDGGTGYLYTWHVNNVLSVGNTSRTFNVTQPGDYRVTIKVPIPNCGIVDTLYSIDNVIVSYKNIIPVGDTVCNASASLSVIGTGKYKWWSAATGGVKVTTGTTYTTPVLGATTTYYVEDTSSFKSHIGPVQPTSGTFNGRRQYPTNLMKLRFTANGPFTIDSVTIGAYNLWDGSFSVTVELRNFVGDALVSSATTPVMSGTLNPTWHKVLLGLNVPAAGDYYLRYASSTPAAGRIAESASGAYTGAFPFNDANGMVSITQYFRGSDGTLQTTMYGMFWDWVISSGNSCSRTPVVATQNCALPVNFIDFKGVAYNHDVYLNWSTSLEKNNHSFIIERSIDGVNFEAIVTVDGNGSTNELSSYSFIDYNAPITQVYYRLIQLDFDGSSTNSSIIVVDLNSKKSSFVYPNPTTDNFTITLFDSGDVSFELFNVEGKLILSEIKNVSPNTTINFGENLAKGYYILRTISNTNVETYSLLKN